MITLEQLWTEPLIWTRTSLFSREYELLAGDQRVASLWREGLTGWRARVESPAGHWVLRRTSRLRGHLKLSEPGSGREIARFRAGWWGGTLTLANGDSYRWRPLNFWHTQRGLVRDNGEPVVRFRGRVPALRHRAEVTVDRDQQSSVDLMAMVMIAGYLFARHRGGGAH